MRPPGLTDLIAPCEYFYLQPAVTRLLLVRSNERVSFLYASLSALSFRVLAEALDYGFSLRYDATAPVRVVSVLRKHEHCAFEFSGSSFA